MKVKFLCYGTLMSNCWVIVEGNEAMVVDAGATAEEMSLALEKNGLEPKGVLLTHGHFDHSLGGAELARKYSIPLYIHEADNEMLSSGEKNAYMMCYGKDIDLGRADVLLSDGDEIAFGGERIKVIHTPGHSRGSVCYLVGDSLLCGDTIFEISVGRWDLYGGDLATLKQSIKKIEGLGGGLVAYSGHGRSCPIEDALTAAYKIIGK